MSRSRSARQCLMIRTDTTLDQDSGTENDCVRMYIVHCLSLSTTSVDFNTPPLTKIAPFDARLVSKSGRIHKTQTSRCIEACPTTAWSRKSVCSLCHHRTFMGSKSYRQLQTWRQSVHKMSRCILPFLCTLPLLCFLQLLS